MATSSNSPVTDTTQDDFLTCHICFEVFTDPRIFPCLHTFCFQCICSHVNSAQADGRPVVCPECQDPISDAVSSLKTNSFIQGLVDLKNEKSAKRVLCTTCHIRGSESTAKMKCLDCGDYLCSTCSDGHNASSLTWKHEKIPLAGIKQGTYDKMLRQRQRVKCPRHDKDVEVYCESCSSSVCLTCVLLEHRDHKCKTITETVCSKKSHIISLTENLRKKLMALRREEDNVKSNLEALNQKAKSENLEIEQRAEQDIAQITANMKIALHKNERKTKDFQVNFESQIEAIYLKNNLVSSCINFSDKFLKMGKNEEVLMLESIVTDRMLTVQSLAKTEDMTDMGLKSSNQESKEPHRLTADLESKSKNIVLDTKADHFDTTSALSDKGAVYNRDQVVSHKDTACQQEDKLRITPPSKENVAITLESKFEIQLKKLNSFSAKYGSKKPDIKGMVYNSKIGVIMSDKSNHKIIIMNKTGGLIREITAVHFQPYAVAVAGDIIGAISGNDLVLFTINGSWNKKVKITDEKPNKGFQFTYSLAASETVGFVLGNIEGDKKLWFYSLDGKATKNIDCAVQFPLAALSITPSGDIVLSEWGSGRLRVISPEGHLKFKVTEKGWKPNGTCTSVDGMVFVAERHWQGVGIYSRTGKHILDYSTSSDGIHNPIHVAIDENGVLYVTNYAGNVCVYTVEKKVKPN